MRAVVVYNSRSGSAPGKRALAAACEKSGITAQEFIDCTANGLEESLAPYLDSKHVIIACGGDGTISSVAGLVAGSKAVLAPIPGGTLNHFTKDLGVVQDADEAIAALPKAKTRMIDTAAVNGTVFVNNSSLGIYPSSLRFRDELKGPFAAKWFATANGALRSFWSFKRYEVAIDGTTYTTPFVFVGNNDYRLEEKLLGERQRLDEGVLSVYLLTAPTRLKLFFALITHHVMARTDEKYIKVWKRRSLSITAKRPKVRVSRDGEHGLLETPVRYELRPKSLRVLGGSMNDGL